MATTSTYKPKGTILPSFEDSAMQKLKSIALPVFDDFKANGKVDVNTLNELAKSQNENLSKIVEYLLELINKQSDTTTNKIKYELLNLADSLVKDQLLSKKEVNENETKLSDNDVEKIKELLRDELKSSNSDKQQTNGLVTNSLEITDIKTHVSNEVVNLQQYISKQIDSLLKNISGLHIRLPKLSFPKLNFPSIKDFTEKLKQFKFPKFKFPKLSMPKFKFPKLQPLKKIKVLGSKVKNTASKVKNAVVKPFAVVGGFFKKLAFGSSSKFTFPKLRKFLIKFFNFKNVAKWITGFLKKHIKIFLNVITKIIKPIKQMLFGAIDLLLNGIGRLLFIYLGPVAIVAWTILALVTLLIVGAVLLVKWIKDNWKRILSFIKSLPSRIWKGIKWIGSKVLSVIKWIGTLIWTGIKWLGKMIWKGIRFIFFDMWIMLGKWLWKKLVQFGTWLWEKIKTLGSWLKKTIVDPIANWFDKNVMSKIRNSAIYKKLKPFIDSVSKFVLTIKNAFKQWDTNKSVWENLKNIGSILKDSIAEWWNSSPFKEKYDKFIKPFVDSVNNLVMRIKDVWKAFKWDENKSFIDNLMGFWNNIKTAIKDWWKSSPFKTYYDKLVNWLSDIIKPVKDWWNSLEIGKKISDIFDWIKELPSKIWEKIKGLFGGIGDIASAIWKKLKRILPSALGGESADDSIKRLNKEIEEAKQRGASVEYIAKLLKELGEAVDEQIDLYQERIDKGETTTSHWFSKNEDNTQILEEYKKQRQLLLIETPKIEIQQDEVNSNIDLAVIELTDSSKNSLLNDIDAHFSTLNNVLQPAFKNIYENFLLVLLKLDEKPNLLPIPFASTDGRNSALMENM